MRIVVVALCFAVLSSAVEAQDKQMLHVPGAVPGLPFSPAVQVGNIIYLSGQIGAPLGEKQIVQGGVEAETRQALSNIRAVLEAAGSSLDRVFKCTVFLADIRDYDVMNRAYGSVFTAEPPARSTVAGTGLAMGAKVEIECMATAGPKGGP